MRQLSLHRAAKSSGTFGEIEQRTGDLLQNIGVFPEGNVLAVQVGNHEDWPSI